MKIAGMYSLKGGDTFIQQHFPHLLAEIQNVIESVDASTCKTKVSKEKTMPGELLYAPTTLNKLFKSQFYTRGWTNKKVESTYSKEYYTPNYDLTELGKGAFREMDFIKEQLGVEVQFGKYSFMVYNVSAKMTIFHNLGFINAGVEIVPVKRLANQMSSGVSYFEQFVWDLENRGVADIDIPVLILGIDV